MQKFLVVVTGVSGEIGAAIAENLLSNYIVLGVSRSSPQAALLSHASFVWLELDLNSNEACEKLHKKIVELKVPLFGLVNNAATNLHMVNKSDIYSNAREIIETNLLSPIGLVLFIKNLFVEYASIVNITSIGSALAFPGNVGYQASKAGLAGATRALAYDLAERKIRVNSVAPGYVPSKMTAASYDNESERLRRASQTILGRWGKAEEIASVVNFLLSDESSYVTGQEIFVDGGWSVKGM